MEVGEGVGFLKRIWLVFKSGEKKMMKKKSVIIIGFLVLIIISIVTYWLNKNKEVNEIRVFVDNSLSVDKVRIEYGIYHSSNFNSDDTLVRNGLEKVVFDGKSHIPFKTRSTENDFLIIYDNEYYTIVRHLIRHDFFDGIPEPHKYLFKLKKQSDKLNLTLDIVGENGEKIERQLQPFSNAKNNKWGELITK